MPAKTAAALIVGNEILTGKIPDENGPFLARELRELGAELRATLLVPDEVEAIAEGVRLLAPRVTALVTSGGVGPTHDDVTMEGVARAFELELRRDAELERLVRECYDPQARPMSLRMADLPAGAELLFAEGLKAPVVRVRNVYVLPGVPAFFRRKFQAIRELFRDSPFHLRELYLSCDEADVAEPLRELTAADPELVIGSYPRFDTSDYRVKVTVESRHAGRVEAAVKKLLAVLPAEWVRQAP